jgi:hypothetical protein
MTSPTPGHVDAIPQLCGLATRIEGKGQYNAAKLLRAAADAVARRAAYERGLSTDLDAIGADFEDAIRTLRKSSVDTAIVDALERARKEVLAGRQTMLPDFPDAYVCRRCGESSLGPPEHACRTCGAWPTTFQRFLPIYWLNELDPPTALQYLRATPLQLDALLDGLSEADMARPPEDGSWSIRQAVTHIRDADAVLNTRVKLIKEEDNPSLAFAPVFAWTAGAAAHAVPTAEIVGQYRATRRDSVERLQALRFEDWWRTGRHDEFGTVTLLAQVSYFAAHELTHLRQIHNGRMTLARSAI